jgi:hypothetical protein
MALRSSLQAKRSSGNLGSRYLNERQLTFWTLSVWESEASMRNFMMSGAHRRAMPKLLDWCEEAALGHWHQEHATLPSWTEAHQQMVSKGRLSKVRNPSPNQLAQRIPPPVRA